MQNHCINSRNELEINKGCDNIFNNLTDFGYQRSTKEAIGFYIAYFFLTIIFVVILGLVFVLIFNALVRNNTNNIGLIFGNTAAIVVSLGVSFLILKDKKLLGNSGFVLLALLSGPLAIFFGAFGGLMPAAYLTTKPANIK